MVYIEISEIYYLRDREIEVIFFHSLSTNQRVNELAEFDKRGGVLLTSYGNVVSQVEKLESLKHKIDYVILDEGHKIKNPNIKVRKS